MSVATVNLEGLKDQIAQEVVGYFAELPTDLLKKTMGVQNKSNKVCNAKSHAISSGEEPLFWYASQSGHTDVCLTPYHFYYVEHGHVEGVAVRILRHVCRVTDWEKVFSPFEDQHSPQAGKDQVLFVNGKELLRVNSICGKIFARLLCGVSEVVANVFLKLRLPLVEKKAEGIYVASSILFSTPHDQCPPPMIGQLGLPSGTIQELKELTHAIKGKKNRLGGLVKIVGGVVVSAVIALVAYCLATQFSFSVYWYGALFVVAIPLIMVVSGIFQLITGHTDASCQIVAQVWLEQHKEELTA